MKIRRASNTEKLDISLRDYIIVLRRCCSWVHCLASLKTLRSLKALIADTALFPPPPAELATVFVTTISTILIVTTKASNMLN